MPVFTPAQQKKRHQFNHPCASWSRVLIMNMHRPEALPNIPASLRMMRYGTRIHFPDHVNKLHLICVSDFRDLFWVAIRVQCTKNNDASSQLRTRGTFFDICENFLMKMDSVRQRTGKK
jgi:hypothetical protein